MKMKNNLFFLFVVALLMLVHVRTLASDRIVGGDLSLVPAYEQSGDQWMDADGTMISDLVTYVQQKGWNCVRVRLFVDPTQDSDPATCQDLDYVTDLGVRIKAAGMKFMLDFHYSDTWADPSTQKIPNAWSGAVGDDTLASNLYAYTYDVVKHLINSQATPDYVQIGNEITYGLLWNTEDGAYPSSSSDYATAGYCPTWSSTFSTGSSQWKRTARLLNNAAHAVHLGFQDSGVDSTAVKLIVHTELGNSQYNGDNFYKHIRTAGFDNYDIIGLSYYPFWHGTLNTLGSQLSAFATDFPEKDVQIVETAWYNSYYPYTTDGTNQFSIASLNSDWTADGTGMVNYLKDLSAKLQQYDRVSGLLYWQPEECGNGFSSSKPVMNGWLNRGMWKNSSARKHSMLSASDGTTPVEALTEFLNEDAGTGESVDAGSYFTNLDFETGDLTGWIIDQSWTTQWPNNISSWASANVYAGTYTLELWNATTSSGSIISQTATLPVGRYTVTLKALAQQSGFYLYANDKQTSITTNTATTWEVTTNVTEGTLTIGIGTSASTSSKYMYADDFTVTYVGEVKEDADEGGESGGDEETETYESVDYTDEQGIVYTLWPASKMANVKSGSTCFGAVTIPATLVRDSVEYYVNSILPDAFYNNSDISSVFIGKNVYEIWGSAFNNCWNMTKVAFEEGSCLSTIGGWAFYNCAMDSIDVPAGVTEIPEGAFGKCWNLDYVALRGNITSIGDFAFSGWAEEGCASSNPLDKGVWIYAIEAPEISEKAFSTEDIANDTLYVHYALVEDEAYTTLGFSAILPLDSADMNVYYYDEQGVKYVLWEDGTAGVVGYDDAHGPNSVSDWQIEIPETLTVDDKEYLVTYINQSAFNGHWGLTSVVLPESLTSIGSWAFYGTAISSIVVYDGVTTIWEGTFGNCWNLTQAEFYGDLDYISDYAFSAWAEEGCATTYASVQNIVLWSTKVPTISSLAFYADDIADAILYVDEDLVDETEYQALGFKDVRPISAYTTAIRPTMVNVETNAIVYDLSGRKVVGNRPGIHIRQGKKILE